MTREEAIRQLGELKFALSGTDEQFLDLVALEMAIKALEQEPCEDATLKDIFCMGCEYKEQEPILDKIRAEIEHVIDYTYDSTDYDKALYNGAYKDGLYEALDIIDKYKAESEDI